MEDKPCNVPRLDVFDVLAIFAGKDNVSDAGTLGRKNLFLDATHRQHLTPQGHFTRHGYARTQLALSILRYNSRSHCNTGRWAVLGYGSFGEVYV